MIVTCRKHSSVRPAVSYDLQTISENSTFDEEKEDKAGGIRIEEAEHPS